MKKRFIIVIDATNSEIEDKMIRYVKANHFGWWHWLDGLWLVTTSDNNITTVSIRDQIGKISLNNTMVFEITENHKLWAGRGPSNDDKNMFTWLKNTWAEQ